MADTTFGLFIFNFQTRFANLRRQDNLAFVKNGRNGRLLQVLERNLAAEQPLKVDSLALL